MLTVIAYKKSLIIIAQYTQLLIFRKFFFCSSNDTSTFVLSKIKQSQSQFST